MNLEFLTLTIIGIVCFTIGFIKGLVLGKYKYQKKIAKILDEVLKEKK